MIPKLSELPSVQNILFPDVNFPEDTLLDEFCSRTMQANMNLGLIVRACGEREDKNDLLRNAMDVLIDMFDLFSSMRTERKEYLRTFAPS